MIRIWKSTTEKNGKHISLQLKIPDQISLKEAHELVEEGEGEIVYIKDNKSRRERKL